MYSMSSKFILFYFFTTNLLAFILSTTEKKKIRMSIVLAETIFAKKNKTLNPSYLRCGRGPRVV